ncbi:hypothetical protein D3C72_1649380 [compost metagenome]
MLAYCDAVRMFSSPSSFLMASTGFLPISLKVWTTSVMSRPVCFDQAKEAWVISTYMVRNGLPAAASCVRTPAAAPTVPLDAATWLAISASWLADSPAALPFSISALANRSVSSEPW